MGLKNKKILVTGGAGFIGSHTVDALIKEGASVVVVDNLVTGRRANLNQKAKFCYLNIADAQIKKVFEKERPEFVYHFAFNVLVPKSVENPLIDMDSIAGSLNIFQNAKNYNVKKIVFSSSGFVYGNNPNLPVKETAFFEPVSPYAVAKHTVESYLKYFNKAYGLPYAILRYSAVYGPRQITGAMADYIRRLAVNKQAEIYGNGTKTRDYVYIDDVIRANLLALNLPNEFENPIFNVSTGKETTLNSLYKKVANLLGKEPRPIYCPDRPGEQIRYSLDNSKIKDVLGWSPRVSLDKGLRIRVDSYRRYKL